MDRQTKRACNRVAFNKKSRQYRWFLALWPQKNPSGMSWDPDTTDVRESKDPEALRVLAETLFEPRSERSGTTVAILEWPDHLFLEREGDDPATHLQKWTLESCRFVVEIKKGGDEEVVTIFKLNDQLRKAAEEILRASRIKV